MSAKNVIIRGYQERAGIPRTDIVCISGGKPGLRIYEHDPFWQSLVSASAIKMLETHDKVEIEQDDVILYTLSR